MADVGEVFPTAIGAFIGTNIDDFAVLLLLILGMPVGGMRSWQIVAGQYIGFSALLVLSGIGAVALRAFASSWVGLLGIVPLTLGAWRFFNAFRDSDASKKAPIPASSVTAVAIVTIANGVITSQSMYCYSGNSVSLMPSSQH